MYDAYVAFSGYRDSPLEGEAFAPFSETYRLLEEHGVEGIRQVGVAVEFACFDRMMSSGDARRPERISRSGPIIDSHPQGFRLTRSVDSKEGVDQAIASLVLEQFDWISLGSLVPPDLVEYAAMAAHGRLCVSVEARSDLAPEVLEDIDCVDGFLGLLTTEPELDHWRQVAELVTFSRAQRLERIEPLVAAGVAVIPLLTATRRRCLLSEVIHADGIDELVAILPFHSRIAELRNPGAYRFGRKHAERYLDLPRLDRDDTKAFEAGFAALGETLSDFAERGGRLAAGSGSPSTGLCPGFSLLEERALWASAGLTPAVIDHGFGPGAEHVVRLRAGDPTLRSTR